MGTAEPEDGSITPRTVPPVAGRRRRGPTALGVAWGARRYAAPRWPRRPAPASPPTCVAEIIDATYAVTLARGLHDLRIADVAEELTVSTGLIHYHFATKDELIEAMLGEVAEREIAGVRRALARLTTPEERLAKAIDIYLPSSRRDRAWVLWIDVWGEALRAANLRRISEESTRRWVCVAEIITEASPPARSAAPTPSSRPGGSAPCSTASASRSSSTTAR